MSEYKCFTQDFDSLVKRIRHITKKLDKYGYKWSFEKLGESVEPVGVYANDDINRVRIRINTIPVEVTLYSFDMEHLQLGEYRVIAVLEHKALTDQSENLIHNLTSNSDSPVEIPIKYRTAKSICEHCNSDRQRNKTVLLQNTNGDFIQVGTTCIKEYTGIDAADVISIYADIHDIVLQDLELDRERVGNYPAYAKTLDYLTACIQLVIEKGYRKETVGTNALATKFEAWELLSTEWQGIKYSAIADNVVKYFRENSFTNDFLNNIKIYLENEYTKASGFVAYAYIAYQKQIELDTKRVAEEEHRKQSEYVGSIKDKFQSELIYKRTISYDTIYGTQYIHLFEDENGNQYKWKTGKILGYWNPDNEWTYIDGDSKVKIKGTIKDHSEYNGVKQTEITRCKVI